VTTNRGGQGRLLATNPGPKPGDFPIGSVLSRAAARLILIGRTQGQLRRELIIGIDEGREPHAGKYGSDPDSAERARLVSIPYGMTIGDGLRVLGGFTEEELVDPKMQHVVDPSDIWTFVH
jgi:hypothetical protein